MTRVANSAAWALPSTLLAVAALLAAAGETVSQGWLGPLFGGAAAVAAPVSLALGLGSRRLGTDPAQRLAQLQRALGAALLLSLAGAASWLLAADWTPLKLALALNAQLLLGAYAVLALAAVQAALFGALSRSLALAAGAALAAHYLDAEPGPAQRALGALAGLGLGCCVLAAALRRAAERAPPAPESVPAPAPGGDEAVQALAVCLHCLALWHAALPWLGAAPLRALHALAFGCACAAALWAHHALERQLNEALDGFRTAARHGASLGQLATLHQRLLGDCLRQQHRLYAVLAGAALSSTSLGTALAPPGGPDWALPTLSLYSALAMVLLSALRQLSLLQAAWPLLWLSALQALLGAGLAAGLADPLARAMALVLGTGAVAALALWQLRRRLGALDHLVIIRQRLGRGGR